MIVKVKESSMVYPAEETPKHTLWLSRLDMIISSPLGHARVVYVYSPIGQENKDSKFFDTEILKMSLSKILVPFYPVAGRLKRNESNDRIEIDCNAAGVLFEEVETTQVLGDFQGFKPENAELRKVVMPTWDYSKGLSSNFPLMIVRVTRFVCGSVCVGFANHHHVGDGLGFTYFINSWARLARGLELDVEPFHDRAMYLSPRNPPQVKFQHLEYEPPLPPKGLSGESAITMQSTFKLSREQIDILKKEVSGYKFSTYEVLAAHVWRSVCKARDLGGDDEVKLYIPIDGRSRLKDVTIPQGYFGNITFFTACLARAGDITCKPLWYAASKVHEALNKVKDVEYLRSAIDYLESQKDVTTLIRGAHSVTSPNLSINSWGRIPLYEADFGWGCPKFVGHGGIRCEGQSYLIQSLDGDGSFSLHINLLSNQMPLLEKYLYNYDSLPTT